MTFRDFQQLGEECTNILRSFAPVKTGNLKFNAIRFEMPNKNTFIIFVDESLAPYMPYTNEVWRQKLIQMGNFLPGGVVERMRTWKNPNEGWFDRAARAISLYVKNKTGGEIET